MLMVASEKRAVPSGLGSLPLARGPLRVEATKIWTGCGEPSGALDTIEPTRFTPSATAVTPVEQPEVAAPSMPRHSQNTAGFAHARFIKG